MKRRLKSLAKLIEEFPGYRFSQSNLWLNESLSIHKDYLNFLGEEVLHASSWDERLLEPLPEPKVRKLYAYINNSQCLVKRRVEFFTEEHGSFAYYKRAPEYDLEFKDGE